MRIRVDGGMSSSARRALFLNHQFPGCCRLKVSLGAQRMITANDVVPAEPSNPPSDTPKEEESSSHDTPSLGALSLFDNISPPTEPSITTTNKTDTPTYAQLQEVATKDLNLYCPEYYLPVHPDPSRRSYAYVCTPSGMTTLLLVRSENY